jgi:hypothetical protein
LLLLLPLARCLVLQEGSQLAVTPSIQQCYQQPHTLLWWEVLVCLQLVV